MEKTPCELRAFCIDFYKTKADKIHTKDFVRIIFEFVA